MNKEEIRQRFVKLNPKHPFSLELTYGYGAKLERLRWHSKWYKRWYSKLKSDPIKYRRYLDEQKVRDSKRIRQKGDEGHIRK